MDRYKLYGRLVGNNRYGERGLNLDYQVAVEFPEHIRPLHSVYLSPITNYKFLV